MNDEETLDNLATLGRPSERKWLGWNRHAVYCDKCGQELRTAEESAGFNEATGARILYCWKYCPTRVRRRFLWWSWWSHPCGRGTPTRSGSQQFYD